MTRQEIPTEDPFKHAQARQTVTAEWDPINPPPIEGVRVVDVKNVIYRGGVLTELYRPEWFADESPISHVVHVSILPGATTQWHCHHNQRDIVFPVRGQIRIGLYDSRPQSPTKGAGCVLHFNLHRPRYLVIPTGVWHALRNTGTDEGVYVVLNDIAFEYEDPDDWTLATGSPDIPVSMD